MDTTQDSQSTTEPYPDTLVVSRLFFPRTGGIEEYAYNRCIRDAQNVRVLAAGCPGDRQFDREQLFEIERWSMPPWLLRGFIGSLLKQVLSMFWSLVLPIVIYRRDRFTTLEWCHGYDFPSLLLLTYILPVKFVVYLHGNDVLCPFRNSLLRSLFILTLNRTDRVICSSSFTKNYLATDGRVKTPTAIVNPQVRPEKFALDATSDLTAERSKIRQTFGIPETAITILTVGRLVRRKGFNRVIQCLPQLQQPDLEVHYLICGKGAMEQELKEQAAELQVTDKVHFAGFVSDRDLANYYAACDIFAMLTFLEPNAQSIEGFGIVYLEAGYFGKPVIASEVGGVIDAVQQGVNGILIDPHSDAAALAGLQKLCSDPQLRQRLGEQGKARASLVTS
ncbi:MAG: glycosyltransferase family 4 protein [Cyanobacteria bacterium P01_C01_bin.72]